MHPYGPIYTQNPDWGDTIEPVPLWFADWILEQRARWRESLRNKGKGGSTGRQNVASAEGEDRNIRLCSLRGALFNRVPEMDDDEIEKALFAYNEQFAVPLDEQEIWDTVLQPKPTWVRHPDDLVKPDIKAAVYAFELLYDLRESAGGEFYARPAAAGTPAVVAEIGDALGLEVARWWRRAAEAWNETIAQRKQEAAKAKAAKKARLSEQEQMEEAKEALEKVFSELPKPPDEDEEEDKTAEVFPAQGRIDTVLYHLRASATQHDRVDLHMRVVDEPEHARPASSPMPCGACCTSSWRPARPIPTPACSGRSTTRSSRRCSAPCTPCSAGS